MRKRPLSFSFWPLYRTSRRFGLQSTVFALDPWILIRSSIKSRCPAASLPEALSCLEQSQDFYSASATAGMMASRPLLLYYCFMNLMKAYALTVQQQSSFDQAQHGFSERLRPSRRELDDAFLQAFTSPNTRNGALNLFDEFLKAISGSGLVADINLDLPVLLPQIVPGHRLWAEAANSRERFISVHDIGFNVNYASNEIWITLDLFADDLTRLGISRATFLSEARLYGTFREVKSDVNIGGRRILRFEQILANHYTGRPSDEVPNLVAAIKPFLWATVASVPPYRRYYLYLAPAAEQPQILPQLLSIYAITYYLGSITRYRPHHFDAIAQGRMGPRIEEFISGQPLQFIYLLASEFAKQDVTKPSIV